MIRIDFPYEGIGPLEVREQDLMGVFSPSSVPADRSEEELINEAFCNPIGPKPLSQAVKGHSKVLIVTDDQTRSTPVRNILPRVVEELEEGGIKPDNVRILIALGTHSPMTHQELVEKLGHAIVVKYPVFNHNYQDASQLSFIGETDAGTPMLVNKMAVEADFIVGIGQIVPHRVSGFSGGGNIIQPGICGEITTGRTHWEAARFTGREILGTIENPVKDEIETVALKTGLKWIVNTIQDGSGRVASLVTGDPIRAYRVGARRSHAIYRSALPAEADIVVAESYPFDSDLWIASKGIYSAELAVKEGGVVILVSPCLSGVSVSHPEVLESGYHSFAEVDRLVQCGALEKLTVAAHLVHVGRVVRERATGILVTRGITREETGRLGLLYAAQPADALQMAFSHCGANAKVAVLRRGSEILPVIEPAE